MVSYNVPIWDDWSVGRSSQVVATTYPYVLGDVDGN